MLQLVAMNTPSLDINSSSFSSLSRTIDTLGHLLGQSIEKIYGQSLLNKVETLRLCCHNASTEKDLIEIKEALKQYQLEDLKKIIHCFAIFFLLSNQSEQCEIIKIKRQRRSLENKDSPRAESITEAIKLLVKSGVSAAELRPILAELKVIPTITAHPTEARRRSVLQKQLKIAEILFSLSAQSLGEFDKQALLQSLQANILGLLVTDDVRAKRLSVQDEVENGVFFLAGAILEIVPEIMSDLSKAFKLYLSESFSTPAVLRYRSWIGGDRDGNPNVTATLTREALSTHRLAIIRHYQKIIRTVRDELSVSTRKVDLDSSLLTSINEDRTSLGLGHNTLVDDHQIFEPLREKCESISLKLAAEAVSSSPYLEKEFIADLLILQKSLSQSRLSELGEFGSLSKLIYQAQAFGFSLADLDLRQHSKVHQACVNELLNALGLCPNYSELEEKAKVATIHQLLSSSIPTTELKLSPESTETLAVFKLISEVTAANRSGLGAYVISMTHTLSDILEPMLLWKLSGGEANFPLALSPLFETIEDLQGSHGLLEAIVSDPYYIKHLDSQQRLQEIMLGYSDSNKDGGYTSANVLLYESQLQIAKVCSAHKIKFQIFHGRGGSVGRGGGRAGRAILSSPPESHSGKVRFTEQGEVISFRYSMPELGHRHLEQIISAVILSAGSSHPSLVESELEELKGIAEVARLKYRSLIDSAGFWEWYVNITPIKFISSLPIASRPVMRAGANLEFENLRAIPWVFSWTQTRYNVPSWYGLGTALDSLFAADHSAVKRMQSLYKQKVFFQSLIDNAQQEMARARLIIAKQYNTSTQEFHLQIENEFILTEKVILMVTDQIALLDNNPVIQRSISRRNPYTDALNLIQVELLRRSRDCTSDEELADLREGMHMSISALAAAMQTTG